VASANVPATSDAIRIMMEASSAERRRFHMNAEA
jgi:hypothetical protein